MDLSNLHALSGNGINTIKNQLITKQIHQIQINIAEDARDAISTLMASDVNVIAKFEFSDGCTVVVASNYFENNHAQLGAAIQIVITNNNNSGLFCTSVIAPNYGSTSNSSDTLAVQQQIVQKQRQMQLKQIYTVKNFMDVFILVVYIQMNLIMLLYKFSLCKYNRI